MNSWDLKSLDLKPRLPEILSSSDAARAIALDLAAGESLSDHQVHERAWLIVLDGEIQVETAEGQRASGGAGLVIDSLPVSAARSSLPRRAAAAVVDPLARQRPSWRDDDPGEAIRAPARRQAGAVSPSPSGAISHPRRDQERAPERFDVPLADLTTLRLGGRAHRLVEATLDDHVVEVVAAADAVGEPLLVMAVVLSNLVIADAGFEGTAIRTDDPGCGGGCERQPRAAHGRGGRTLGRAGRARGSRRAGGDRVPGRDPRLDRRDADPERRSLRTAGGRGDRARCAHTTGRAAGAGRQACGAATAGSAIARARSEPLRPLSWC